MNSSHYKPIALFTLLIGAMFNTPLLAETDSRGQGHHMMRHGGGGSMHGPGYRGYGMHGSSWRYSLSDEQRPKIEKMKLDYYKKKMPLKAKKKTLKTELALLVTKDNASKAGINSKIDQYLRVKKQLLRLKYAHKIAVRKELTPEQRVSFDLAVMKKSSRARRRH